MIEIDRYCTRAKRREEVNLRHRVRSKNLVDYKFDKKVFEPFDVIQKFEKLSGISSKVELM